MEFGFCSTTLIPCRAEASDKAEQINQLLFGESYSVLEKQEKWIKIMTTGDEYEGWIDAKLHCPLNQEAYNNFNRTEKRVIHEPVFLLYHENSKTNVILSHGCIVPVGNGKFSIGDQHYSHATVSSTSKDIPAYSTAFLNTPYLWGGKSIFGADCSGFTQVVFRANNIWIPRDAYQQAELGDPVQLEDVQPGDLAFFGKEGGKITHVGICLEGGKIIHCSGRCRIDTLDEKGIYNEETSNYSHDLRSIKRL